MPNQIYSSGYVRPKSPGRTKFDLSHERVLSCNMGQLIPVLSEMAYPGDHFRISARAVVRFNPLIHPLMHKVNGTIHYFAVPLRLLYPKDQPDDTDSRITPFSFEESIMGGADGVDIGIDDDFMNTKFFLRTFAHENIGSPDIAPGLYHGTQSTSDWVADPATSTGSLWDFFRFAPSVGGETYPTPGSDAVHPDWRCIKVKIAETFPGSGNYTGSAMPMTAPWLAYHFIWWENYRDPFIKASPVAGYDPAFVANYNSQLWTPLLTDFAYSWSDSKCKPGTPFNPLSISDIRRPRYRAYEKDYFTSAQLQAQRGPAGIVDVTGFGVAGMALPVQYNDGDNVARIFGGVGSSNGAPNSSLGLAVSGVSVPAGSRQVNYAVVDIGSVNGTDPSPGQAVVQTLDGVDIDNSGYGTYPGAIQAQLPGIENSLGQFDINSLILAYAMQHHANINQRFGNRFTDYIFGHFDVVVRDDRLQRPEYIGGMQFPVIFSEVLQTSSSTNGENALGELGGHGMAVSGDHCVSYYVPEHSVIMGILNIQPVATYGQGFDRQWIKNSRYDFYTPDFSTIGEQGVLDLEIMAQTYIGVDTDLPMEPFIDESSIFGFQGAFDHYRQRTSSYHGLMHTSLASWHLGRFFGNKPVLNTDFITTTADDWDRAFAVTSEVADELVVTVGQNIFATRPMPYMAVPHIDGMED